MLLGRVEGHAISTVKHRSLKGWRLVVIQPVRGTTNDPLLAIDSLGSRDGDLVVVTNDGSGARKLVGDNTSPVRWSVVAIVDPSSQVGV